MSLVHLADVCSHLQNASLARLGLTSIPYTKLHLSLSLLLHKQGFLSQVKLGGPAAPASCFPSAVADNHHVTAGPHRERSPKSGEAALTEVVFNRKTRTDLVRAGFSQEAVEFAMQSRVLSKEQLERDGWDIKVVDFLLRNSGRSREDLEREGLDTQAMQICDKYSVPAALDRVRDDLLARGVVNAESVEQQYFGIGRANLEKRVRALLRKDGFDLETLQYFAGPARFATPRHLEQDGISVSVMGLTVTNQSFTPLPSHYQDPFDLETEGLVTQANRATRRLWLGLKYWDGMPVLSKARMLSKPTKRIWLDTAELGRVVRGKAAGEVKGMAQVGEVVAVSTDRGVMEARECVERKVGGMVLCRVW